MNWDLRNYHLYTPLHLIRGNLDRDFLAAGLQTYFNPTLDFIYAYLSMGPLFNFPRLLAGFMGLWYGALIFAVLRLSALLFEQYPQREAWVFLATLTAVTGAATWSQIGTTMNEVTLAAFIIGGLACVSRALSAETSMMTDFRLVAIGGALFGIAAGLKLTVCVYAFALCIALLSVFSFFRWVRVCLVFSLGWIAGFVPFFSWWGWIIWQRFQSPTFPLFNGLFKSPYYPPESFFDQRFFPRDALQWLFYPYFWIWKVRGGLVSELDFRDPRMAIAMTLLIVLPFPFLLARKKKISFPYFSQPQRFCISFLIYSYLVWLLTSSILRYAVAIEVLAVLISIVLVHHFAALLPDKKRNKAHLFLGILVCVLSLATTRVMDWGHVPFGKKVYDVDMTWTQQNTLFVSITGPTAYLAAFVPPEKDVRFVGFSFTTLTAKDWLLGAKTKEIVTSHQGPIVVLIPDGMRDFTKNLPVIGLSADVGECRIVHSNLDQARGEPVTACATKKMSDG